MPKENTIQQIVDWVKQQNPNFTTKLRGSKEPQKTQFLDIIQSDVHIAVEWTQDKGFGVSDCSSQSDLYGWG